MQKSQHLGPNSQNMLSQISWICITLGLNIMKILRLKLFFKAKYHLRWMLPTIKIINCLFLCVIASQIHLKVTKILRICRKKFCEFEP